MAPAELGDVDVVVAAVVVDAVVAVALVIAVIYLKGGLKPWLAFVIYLDGHFNPRYLRQYYMML